MTAPISVQARELNDGCSRTRARSRQPSIFAAGPGAVARARGEPIHTPASSARWSRAQHCLATLTVTLLALSCGPSTKDPTTRAHAEALGQGDEGAPWDRRLAAEGGEQGEGWVGEQDSASKDAGPAARVLAWMDPDARAIAVMDDALLALDADAMASIFALPPRARALWATPAQLQWSLGNLEIDALRASLQGPWLVVLPALSDRPYVVRRSTLPLPALKTALDRDFVAGEESGFPSFKPSGAFPYKIVQLESDMLGFIPVGELASGLSPLTAARDIPPTALREELISTFKADEQLLGVLVAGGPLLHLRFAPLVARMRLTARKTEAAGLDVEGAMALVDESAEAVASVLDADGDAHASDSLRALGKEAAFYAEGVSNVAVRLELDAQELRAIEVQP